MAKVTIVSPAGNPEVWSEERAQEKLQAGYMSFEAWQAQQEAEALAAYEAWLQNPETLNERFMMLRERRDSLIAETDYLMAQDYPLAEAKRGEVAAYRQALRDLPAMEGAPWDGGGGLTPFPAKPEI